MPLPGDRANNFKNPELLELTIDDLTEVQINSRRPTSRTSSKTLSKSELGIIKFPQDLESSGVPHVLFKIFETQTGAVAVSDPTTASIIAGGQAAVSRVAATTDALGSVGSTAAGAALGATLGKSGFSTATGAALGLVASNSTAANVANGLVNDAAKSLFGITDITSRAKQLINNFALKRNIVQQRLAIAMFMPENLAVSYGNSYEGISITSELGGIGLAAQALGSKIGQAGEAANPYIVEGAARLAGVNDNLATLGLFGATGRTVNPQLELIYNSPELREFRMDFRLVPRNSIEADIINSIIYNLKYFAAPEIPLNTAGRYFIPPAQFQLEFYDSSNNKNTFLFRTKNSVLKDISVDYTGSGSFVTFSDGAPVEIRLSLSFQETVMIDKKAISEGY